MGRNPIIKKAVLEVLEESKTALRFSNLKTKVEEKLRKQIHAEVLAAANKSLLRDGLIEKKLSGGKIVYELSSQFHKQTTKNLLLRLVESLRLDELSANFDLSKRTLTRIISISPTRKDTFETADESKLGIGLDVDWESPSSAISSIICNDFLLLSPSTQAGITNLMLWAYWIKVQSLKHPQKIYDVEMPSMENNLKRCLSFSTGVLNKAKEKGDIQRIKTEEAIIEILNITLELLKKDNLDDFLNYANEKEREVKKAENTILAINGNFTATGERIFHNIVETKSDIGMQGLNLVERKIGKIKGLKSFFEEPELPKDEAVWNYFIDFLIDLCPNDFIKEVRGGYEEAIANAKAYLSYLNDLISLIRKRQIMAVYLWNIPVKKEAEKYLKLPQFEAWFKALKDGDLSHRIWLFEEETIKDVESAYRAVKRGKEPKPWKIDKEFWTLRDLYELHPQGKNPEFWQEMLTVLRTRKGQEPYRGGPVPQDIYYEFIQKERAAVKKLIEKQNKS